jgi:hypothetical protein
MPLVFGFQAAEFKGLFANCTVIGISDNRAYFAVNLNRVFGTCTNQARLFAQTFFDGL